MPRRLAPSVSEAQNQGARFSPQASETRMRRITHVAVLAALVAASANSRHCPTRWPRQRFHRWPRAAIHTDQGAQVHDRRGHLAQPRSSSDGRTMSSSSSETSTRCRSAVARRRASRGARHRCEIPASPDGKHVAFVSDRSGSDNLWVANADGTSPRQLSRDNNNTQYHSPS